MYDGALGAGLAGEQHLAQEDIARSERDFKGLFYVVRCVPRSAGNGVTLGPLVRHCVESEYIQRSRRETVVSAAVFRHVIPAPGLLLEPVCRGVAVEVQGQCERRARGITVPYIKSNQRADFLLGAAKVAEFLRKRMGNHVYAHDIEGERAKRQRRG